MAQADALHRQRVEDIGNLRVRNARGEMVPIGSIVTVVPSYGPDPGYALIRLPGCRSYWRFRSQNPLIWTGGYQTDGDRRQGVASWHCYAVDRLSYQQVTQSHAAAVVFPLAVMLAFLVLAALYESWTLPLAVILIVPVCMCAALLGVWLTGGDNNVFVQVGLVVLMGLACKNAILIVEFARELETQGKSIVEAALEACRMRLRPIVMTSIAFIGGSIPLLLGHGAGSEVRAATGITRFWNARCDTVWSLPDSGVLCSSAYMDEERGSRRIKRVSRRMGGEQCLIANQFSRQCSLLGLTACSVGPRYKQPTLALPQQFTAPDTATVDVSPHADAQLSRVLA